MAYEKERLSRRRVFIEKSLLVSGGSRLGLGLGELPLPVSAKEGSDPPVAKPPALGLPAGTIGKLKVSRLICGGNLFAGHSHSRD